jgi:hypothetical protein
MIYKGGFGRLFLCSEKKEQGANKLLRPTVKALCNELQRF